MVDLLAFTKDIFNRKLHFFVHCHIRQVCAQVLLFTAQSIPTLISSHELPVKEIPQFLK